MVFSLMILVAPATALAGTISGTVTNACTGSTLDGATVAVLIVLGKSTITVTDTTGKAGDYSISHADIVSGSSYFVGASKSGFSSQSATVSIPLKVAAATKHFSLDPAPTLPTVTTGSAGPIGTTTATLNGAIDPNCGVTDYYFLYGTSTSYGLPPITGSISSGSSSVPVSAALSGLSSSTTYHFKLVASNSKGTVYGADNFFTTGTVPPVVTTAAASSITGTSATLNGTVNPNNALTTYYFEHGTTMSYGKKTVYTDLPKGTKTVSVSVPLSAFNYGTTYHYRLVAYNAGGTTYGADKYFKTLSLPSVATGSAIVVTGTTARLNATVVPNGSSTTYRFQYGLDTAYSSHTSYASAGSGTTAVAVSADISGLTPGATYHYRLEAYNGASANHVYGGDSTFTTPRLPVATTLAADGITNDDAVLNGTIDPKGNDTAYWFEIGLTSKVLFPLPVQGPVSGSAKATPVSYVISGLQPGTLYYYRLVGENIGGTDTGSVLSFTTLAPTVTTGPVAYLTQTTAGLTGTVDPNGISTTYYFQYGLTTAYGSTSSVGTGSGTKALSVSAETDELALDTVYHYRLVAEGGGETFYGADRTFASAAPPEATTLAASNITGTSVVLNGTVNPRGLNTFVHFEYGPTTSLGYATPMVNIGAGLDDLNHTAEIGYLLQSKTYYYRLVATNELATNSPVYGAQLNFTTANAPKVETGTAINVTGTTATLTGTVNPNGLDIYFAIEYGTDQTYGMASPVQGPKNGTGDIAVEAQISGLSVDTVYHYRLVAEAAGQDIYGKDGTFYTSQETYRFKRMWPNLQQPWYFNDPEGVAVDAAGFVYVADRINNCVHKFTLDGNFLEKFGRADGNSGSADGEFNAPIDVAVDSKGYVYVGERFNSGRIQIFDNSGKHVATFGESGPFAGVTGLDVDDNGHLYVSDSNNYIWRITYKVGKHIPYCATWPNCKPVDFSIFETINWGGPGEIGWARGIGVDRANGYVYVADSNNDRVLKYNSDGQKLLQTWTNDGLMDTPVDAAVDRYGYVYVAEQGGYGNYRVTKFNSDGTLIDTLVSGYGHGPGELARMEGLAVDHRGVLYVADTQNDRIQLFTSRASSASGRARFLSRWSSNGWESGFFHSPWSIAVESDGTAYVADAYNFRIQKFSSGGITLGEWGVNGTGPGEFSGSFGPQNIAVDNSGHVYAVDGQSNHRIQKFTTSGDYVTEITDFGSASPISGNNIAADSSENLYVTAETKVGEAFIGYIQKFKLKDDGSGDYEFAAEWTTNQLGYACTPIAVAADSGNGLVYAISYIGPDPPYTEYMVQVFTMAGALVRQWSQPIINNSGYAGFDITVDSDGFLYTVDRRGNRMLKYTPGGYHQVTEWIYEEGFYPHQLKNPTIDVDGGGNLYFVDKYNNRVQKFEKYSASQKTKAIVVAGGGPFPGNNLWDATRMVTHFAYRTLAYQGYTRDDIRYLSSDTQVDLDGNGIFDDIDGEATTANLQDAIVNWAADAESLVIYLADHGGEDHFRMSETETLSGDSLAGWLNQLQQTMSGRVIVIYEACNAGSFLQTLASSENRIVITSTSPGESAYFMTQGSVSFSNFFWTEIFNGQDLQTALVNAKQAIGEIADFQHPLMDTDGDGQDNASDGYAGATGVFIGSGTDAYEEAPVIGSVSPVDTITDPVTMEIYADNVTDPDGVARVWAIIRPPGFSQGSANNPVQELPTVDLQQDDDGRYVASFKGPFANGTYQIAIYARDRIGNTSLPVVTEISVNEATSRKAIILAASDKADPQADPLWTSVENCAGLAYTAMKFQGYKDENIYFMSPVAFSPGVDTSSAPTQNDLAAALGSWAQDHTQDVVLYLIGHSGHDAFKINDTAVLTSAELDTLLDDLQSVITGTVTVVMDASYSGDFVSKLAPTEGQARILISSSSGTEASQFLSNGLVSFSYTFWNTVLNGINLRDSFLTAKNVAAYALDNQQPSLDDDGSGIGNEATDGEAARNVTIGMGILLSGISPQSGDLVADIVLDDGSTSAHIYVDTVTSTGSIDSVFAILAPPSPLPQKLPGKASAGLPPVTLLDEGNGRYGAMVDFPDFGLYRVAVFVKDGEGNLSVPKTTTVFQWVGPDVFETDDTSGQAAIINPDTLAQQHNFHSADDQDWVRFYAMEGESYDIVTNELGSNCDTTITIEDKNGEHFSNNLLTWTCPTSGVYYAKIAHSGQVAFGLESNYSLSISHMEGGVPGDLVGQVIDPANDGIGGAVVQSTGLGNFSTISYPNGYYIMTVPSGTHTLLSTAAGYEDQVTSGIVVQANNSNYKDITMAADQTPATVTITYSTTSPTNLDVTATISSSESITVTNNGEEDTYTFTENGSFTFEFEDNFGNSSTATATVSWIDKEPPIATITYSPATLTNQDVTATVGLSDGTVTSIGGGSRVFTEDGSFTFTFADAVGNTGSAVATVDWIDKDAPTATVSYSPSGPTNQNVTATLIPSESVTAMNNGGALSKEFADNGSFTFEFVDAAGNTGSATATVGNIDRTPPTYTVTYNPQTLTNQNVIATIVLSDGSVTSAGGATHTFTADGSFTFEFVDEAGNTGSAVAAVDWIDKAAPTSTISYSITEPTNQNVTATIALSDGTVTNPADGNSHTFTANGSFTFEFTDGINQGTATATVNWIDKTPPTPTIIYSTEADTNQDVTATITLSDGTVTSVGGDLHTFTENGNFTFTFEDSVGNTGSVVATVDWIDKTAPTAVMNYSTLDPTNQDVVATLDPSEAVTVTNNGGSLDYTFDDNGDFIFQFTDAAGNTGTAMAVVNWIDKTAPTAIMNYSTLDPTNQDVVAMLDPSEVVTVTNNGGSATYTFTDNGIFTFNFSDATGNTGTVVAEVGWIDKSAPTAAITYSIIPVTNQDVVATLEPSEAVTVTSAGGGTHTFTANGSFTFTFTDTAGNIGSATASVSNIDKVPPIASIEYAPATTTNQPVVATLTLTDGFVTSPGGNTHTFTENGSFTFTFEDTAGNTGTADAEVTWIDTTPSGATISYSTTSLTSQDVVATIILDDAGGKVTNNGESNTYTFTENDSFTFTFVDSVENPGSATATVNWIDKTAPTANVTYSTTQPTKQNVQAVLASNEAIIITNNGGSETRTFTQNDAFTFAFSDAAGNEGTAIAAVDWIDKTAPTATIAYSGANPTNNDVTATLNPSEAVTVTNNGGLLTRTFTDNGEFTFSFTDAVGHTGTAVAMVDWIDKTAPTATIAYSSTEPTNQSVLATLNPSEAVTVTNNGGSATYAFNDNGVFTFEFIDAAGNTGSATATVDNIDLTPPTVVLSGVPSGIVSTNTFEITVGDGIAQYRYQLDGGEYGPVRDAAVPIALSNLSEGAHTLNVIGRDAAGNWQAEADATGTMWEIVCKGNLNGDDQLDLADVMIAIKAMAGMDSTDLLRADYATSGADVNGDGRVGAAEVLYLLQKIAVARP